MLNPTPRERLLDPQGRPYFLWDCELTDGQFRTLLVDADPQVRAATIGKLMRQAKPDDVFQYVTEDQVREQWDEILPYLGQTRRFWTWLFETWSQLDG